MCRVRTCGCKNMKKIYECIPVHSVFLKKVYLAFLFWTTMKRLFKWIQKGNSPKCSFPANWRVQFPSFFNISTTIDGEKLILMTGSLSQFVVYFIGDGFQPLVAGAFLYIAVIGQVLEP